MLLQVFKALVLIHDNRVWVLQNLMLWGLRLAALLGVTLRGSQVCSALQPPRAALVWPYGPPLHITRPAALTGLYTPKEKAPKPMLA
ncbi:hypothetical protein SGRA_2060 [Saprospira grandis str. Lewin]|uniref:Uncharacterized protein n=1 Tax=Saprospira grandis (strain Lewin) TaxID=984262 RepID=H6L2N4_SAPGL|nr:hypothetical protein SGRA_2060 [Saprospira grandis str. Lewin]